MTEEVVLNDNFDIDPYTGNLTETTTKEFITPTEPYVPYVGGGSSSSKPGWGFTAAMLTLLAIVIVVTVLILVCIPRNQKDGYTILERFERNRQLRRDERNKEEFRERMKNQKKNKKKIPKTI